MPYISKDFIQHRLLPRIDLVRLVQNYCTLKKSGSNYTCCCPFHNERTPSFNVSPSRQTFKCFGCGKGGNAIDFIKLYKNLSFPDAIEELARFAGVEVEYDQNAKAAKREDKNKQYYELMDRVASFFTGELNKNEQAMSYFKNTRGLSQEIISKARLGYAPADFSYVRDKIARNEDEYKKLVELSIQIDRFDPDKQRRISCPFFRDRVVFPIYDIKGRIIAFGGRLLAGDGPKYLNTSETPIFKKRRELFGLYECLQATRNRPEQIVVVEGYMDAIALRQAGFNYVVATLGTAMTPDHLNLLFRYTNKVICCFDSDEAGKKAAWRALKMVTPVLTSVDKEVRFVNLPPGHDPDTLVRSQGAAAFEKLLKESLSYPETVLIHESKVYDIKDPSQRVHYMNHVLSIVKAMKLSSWQTVTMQLLSRYLGVSLESVQAAFQECSVAPDFTGNYYGNDFDDNSLSAPNGRSWGNRNWSGNSYAGNGRVSAPKLPPYQVEPHQYFIGSNTNNRDNSWRDNQRRWENQRNRSAPAPASYQSPAQLPAPTQSPAPVPGSSQGQYQGTAPYHNQSYNHGYTVPGAAVTAAAAAGAAAAGAGTAADAAAVPNGQVSPAPAGQSGQQTMSQMVTGAQQVMTVPQHMGGWQHQSGIQVTSDNVLLPNGGALQTVAANAQEQWVQQRPGYKGAGAPAQVSPVSRQEFNPFAHSGGLVPIEKLQQQLISEEIARNQQTPAADYLNLGPDGAPVAGAANFRDDEPSGEYYEGGRGPGAPGLAAAVTLDPASETNGVQSPGINMPGVSASAPASAVPVSAVPASGAQAAAGLETGDNPALPVVRERREGLTIEEMNTYQSVVGHSFNLADLTSSAYRMLSFMLQHPTIVANMYDSFNFDQFLKLGHKLRICEYPCFERLLHLIKKEPTISSASIIEEYRDTDFEPLFSLLMDIDIFGQTDSGEDWGMDIKMSYLACFAQNTLVEPLKIREYNLMAQRGADTNNRDLKELTALSQVINREPPSI